MNEKIQYLREKLKSKNMDCGYLITYDFRKKRPQHFEECKWIEWDGKRIFDVVLRPGEEEV